MAQLLNAKELVINRGRQHGVCEGMIYAVLSESPIDIVDPETKEDIGVVDREKVRVRVTDVQERMTICATFGSRTIRGGPLYVSYLPTMVGMARPPKKVEETLRWDDSSLPKPLSQGESFVKVNDRVILVTRDGDLHVHYKSRAFELAEQYELQKALIGIAVNDASKDNLEEHAFDAILEDCILHCEHTGEGRERSITLVNLEKRGDK